MGFGASSRMHTAKILRLSTDLPLVIEIVDSEQKIQDFLPVLDGMMGGGLLTALIGYRFVLKKLDYPSQVTRGAMAPSTRR